MYAKIVTLALAIAVATAPGQTSERQQLQQAQMLQLLMQLQQATPPAGAPSANLSPEQLQRLVQALSSGQNQSPALNAALIKAWLAAQAPAAGVQPPQPPAAAVFLIRQGDRQISATPHTRESIFVKTKSNDVADALKSQALSEGISLGAAAAARKIAAGVPYFAGMSSMVGRLNMFGGGKVKGFEFDFLRGLNAPVQLKATALEIQIPPASALPGAAETAFEPLLLRLKLDEKDKVRILATRKLQLAPAKPSAFSGQDGGSFEREVLSAEYESVPLHAQRNADGSIVVRIEQVLSPGEYALVLQKPEPKVFRLLDSVLDFSISQ